MTQKNRVTMPGRLVGVLVVLGIQVLANGFLGWLLIDQLDDDARHGRSADGTGAFSFFGYLSLVLAVVLLVCGVLTVRPRPWARPVIIGIEGIAIVSGVVNIVNGAVAGFIGILIAVIVIGVLLRDDVREWYRARS